MRHEIVDGDHYISPAPSTKHQTVSRRIQFQLYEQIELTGRGQVPDLIIEILSDSNPEHDRVLKLGMYQRAQVPEYWIVDPEEEFVETYVLTEGRLKLVGTYRDSIGVVIMPETSVNLKQAWGK
jgi:hypothetical protein